MDSAAATRHARLRDDLEARQLVFNHAARGVLETLRALDALIGECESLATKGAALPEPVAAKAAALAKAAQTVRDAFPTLRFSLPGQLAAVRRAYRELLGEQHQDAEDAEALAL